MFIRKHWQWFCLGCLFSVVSTVVWANTASMQTTLHRIDTLLNQVNPLITLAEQQQDPTARIQFHGELLRRDIARIQAGIKQALQPISIQPRRVKPLVGDYLIPRIPHTTVPAQATS